MTERIICCGFGGQGILVMGKFLSYLAIETGMHTTYLPAYGTEVRGGTAHCMVTISDDEIYSPFIEKADTVIAMNEPSLIKFEKRIRPGGLLLINKSLITSNPTRKDLKIIKYPFTESAAEIGNIKCANTIALGIFLSIKKIAAQKSAESVLNHMLSGLSPEIFEVNLKAFEKGFRGLRA